MSRQKRGSTGYDGYKKVKENKLYALVDRSGLPLACTVSPANVHDSRFYKPTVGAFEILGVQDHPLIISADGATLPGRSTATARNDEFGAMYP